MATLGLSFWDEKNQTTHSIKVHTHTKNFDSIMTEWAKLAENYNPYQQLTVSFLEHCSTRCEGETERW